MCYEMQSVQIIQGLSCGAKDHISKCSMDLKGKKLRRFRFLGFVEVECGGFVTDASLLGELGPPGQSLRWMLGEVQDKAVSPSQWIWIKRNNDNWRSE